MHEINIKNLTTANQEFCIAREAMVERFRRFHDRHSPEGPLPKDNYSQRKRAACSVATTISQNSLIMMYAVQKECYAPGLTLLRPALEALLKVFALAQCEDKSDWEEILLNEKRVSVTHERLSAAAKATGLPDLGPMWKSISREVNNLIHQRGSLLLTAIGKEPEEEIVLSNPIEQWVKPVYHASMIWEAAIIATIALGSAHAITWELLRDERRSEQCREDLANEVWDRIKSSRNGQTVYIVCRPPEDRTNASGNPKER